MCGLFSSSRSYYLDLGIFYYGILLIIMSLVLQFSSFCALFFAIYFAIIMTSLAASMMA